MFIAGLLISCGPRINTEKKTAKDLHSFTSYAFLPNQDTIRTSNFDNAFVNEVVIDQVNVNMQELGYRLDKNQPDLLVYYHLMMDEGVAVNADPVYTNFSYYRPGFYVGPYYRNFAYNNYFTVPRLSGRSIDQIPYKEGTIVIDIIDRRTNEILWRGKADNVITKNNLEKKIRTYINAIFENYPKG